MEGFDYKEKVGFKVLYNQPTESRLAIVSRQVSHEKSEVNNKWNNRLSKYESNVIWIFVEPSG